MDEKKYLILYYTRYGSTKVTAERLNDELGMESDLMQIKDVKKGIIEKYEIIIIGNPIYMMKFPKKANFFLEKYKKVLLTKKLAFYILCTMTEEQVLTGYGKNWILNYISNDIFRNVVLYSILGGERYMDKLSSSDRMFLKIGKKIYKDKINIEDFNHTSPEKVREFAKKLNKVIKN